MTPGTTPVAAPGPARSAVARRTSIVLATIAVLGSVLSLLGRAFDLPRLTDWFGTGVFQLPNNALGVIACGLGLLALAHGHRLLAILFSLASAMVGGAVLYQHAFGGDLGIDTLVLHRDWGQAATVMPGRIGVPSSVSLLLAGLSIALATLQGGRRSAAIGALLVMVIVSLSIVGYLFGVDRLYLLPKLTSIALQSSVLILALALGLLAALPEQQPVRTLLGDGSASELVRRVLPGLLLAPVLAGWLLVSGRDAGYFDGAFGIAVLVVALLVAFCGLLWWAAAAVHRHEREVEANRARLAGVVNSFSDALAILDADWRIVFANDEVQRRLGKSSDALVGTRLWDHIEAEGSELQRQLQHAMASREGVGYEFFYSPWQRWFADRAYPTPDGGLAITSRDVTEAHAAAERLQQLAADLREQDRRKDEFLATLAHELRNPLAPIQTSLDILKRSRHDPALSSKVMETMQRQLQHMIRLIDDLLDVSRITRDKLALRPERVDLGGVARTAAEACDGLFRAADQVFTLDVPTDGIALDADPVRLSQVIVNLLTNASRYTPRGGRISLALEAIGAEAVVTVRDNGLGIDAEMLPRIFDMFTQAPRPAEQSGGGGLGIGLTLVRRLVELHGGTVTAASAGAGAGSVFVVRLPLAAVPLAAGVPAVAATTQPPAGLRRVLVVDDNRDAADMLQRLLSLAGLEAQVAFDGPGALAAYSALQPQVVLLDIGLPEQDGYAVCRALRALPGGDAVRIVAVTGWGKEEDRRLSREAGFDAHLVKPVAFDALVAALSPGAHAGAAPEPGKTNAAWG
jgi:signal transduction histidine kinase/ActR/RegA family two-component response regulator